MATATTVLIVDNVLEVPAQVAADEPAEGPRWSKYGRDDLCLN